MKIPSNPRRAVVFLIVAILLLLGVGSAAAVDRIRNHRPGDRLIAECPSGWKNTHGDHDTLIAECAALNPPATPVPPSGGTSSWHPATDHEHGDAPPTWVQEWSTYHLGHGVVFGGDETSSPAEDHHKHQAFKGVIFTSNTGGEGYLRYHAASNPLDRSSRYHSYELFYRDSLGGISSWQGWYDTGDPWERCPRRNPIATCELTRPQIAPVDETSISQGASTCEQWYMQTTGSWGWALGVFICEATYLYRGDENDTAGDLSSWVRFPAPSHGLKRFAEGAWYLHHPHPSGWFCATSLGEIVGCDQAGALPQHLAPTLDEEARSAGNSIRFYVTRTWECPGCGSIN